MVLIFGAFFWLLALAAVARLWYLNRPRMRAYAWPLGLLALAAAGLLFRPHEDIFGGEDPGAYLNSGVTYGRKEALLYVDPLLVQVPPETRPAFYYGHWLYGLTKDNCLEVADADRALLGPRFQPAYPLMISVLTRLGSNQWALYVIPLFALFTGFILMALASRLLAHRLAGLVAFGCYLLNPMTLWHARCARPEIIAAFMFFAGLAILLPACQARPWTRWRDILLGTLCIGAAPLFHITAWYLVIPAAAAAALLILRGRADFLIYPLVALGMLFLFYGQVRYVTDYYRVQRFFEALSGYWPVLALGLAVLAGISLAVQRARRGTAPAGNESPAVSIWPAAGLALASALFIINTFFTRDSIGSLPIMGRPVRNYIYLIDWRTFANMVSIPMALIFLAGWVAWLTGDRARRLERIGLAMIVFPALVLAGTMRDFMMTRYLLVTVIPMAALCLAALATRIPEWPGRPWTAWLAPGLAAIICLAGLTNRGHLVTLVEHRGFLRFLAPFAETIRQDHGILLGEYSRITAPIEHMFGVPALGLDNERKDDYSAAERAWETIMRAHPDRAAFFLTPFQAPRSDRFDFTLVKRGDYKGRKLQQAYNNLPTRINETRLTLALYRMALKSTAPAAVQTNALALALENGNMGLRRFANVRVDKPVLDGIALAAGERVELAIPVDPHPGALDLLLVMDCPDACPQAPLVGGAGAALPARGNFQFQQLDGRWWSYTCRLNLSGASNAMAITASSPLFITAAFGCGPTNATGILAGFSKEKERRVLPPLKGRWARADAAFLLPATAPGYVLMLALTPRTVPAGGAAAPKLLLWDEAIRRLTIEDLRPGAWQWLILPLSPARTREAWLRFQVDPPWNPRKAGFPSDLGIFFGKIIVTAAPQ